MKDHIKRFIRRFLAPYRLRRSWLTRISTTTDDHIQTYWSAESQPNRLFMLDLIESEIKNYLADHVEMGLLEYGSHVGLNLKLINDRFGSAKKIKYFAVEPNAEAVAFLKTNLSFVSVFESEDEKFCKELNYPPSNLRYFSLINSVFYCMDAKRVRSVLNKISKFSDVIVIGDSINNIDGHSSRLRDAPECFEHPYQFFLKEYGFEITTIHSAPDPKPQLNGYIIARKSKVER